MRKAMFTVAVLLISSSLLCPLHARKFLLLSYRELFDRSDVVIIATPTAQTTDTTEPSFLLDLFGKDSQGRPTRVAVETPFKVSVILKGDQALERFVLHHYREAKAEPVANGGPMLVLLEPGPMLLRFDPADVAKRASCLMFLVRESDGRYAPTAGQTDPGVNSVVSVPLDIAAVASSTPKP